LATRTGITSLELACSGQNEARADWGETNERRAPNSWFTPGPPGSVGRDSSTGNLCFESASVALRPRIFDSPWHFARKVLGWSKRTAQRNKKLGFNLEWYPQLDNAIRQWLDVGSATCLTEVISDNSANRWIAVAQRVGNLELRRAVKDAQHTSGQDTLEQYERAISAADRWAKEQRKGSSPSVPSAGGPLLVALPHAAQNQSAQQAKPVKAPPKLPEASKWFVNDVKLPKQYGFSKVKARDGFQCQNPECGKTTLRTEAHHIHWRSRGGSDDLTNGVTVCRVCHLRGLHTGTAGASPRIVVEPIVLGKDLSALLWTYTDGRQVLAFR
jgi:hypothetical protein